MYFIMMVIADTCRKLWISVYCCHWIDTSVCGLFVGIIMPVVSASAFTWFIRYIYYCNL